MGFRTKENYTIWDWSRTKIYQQMWWRKDYPAQKMLMRLRINDMIHFGDTDEIFRIQKMSGSKLAMAPHTEANADARHRDKEDPFKFLNIAPSKLQTRGAVKIHISPTGLISEGRWTD